MSQMASRTVQPFAGLTFVTDRHTDRLTDRPRYSVSSNRPHLHSTYCDAAW